MKKILKNVTSEKQHQHSKLMDEFKKAHKKMFRAPEGGDNSGAAPTVGKETLVSKPPTTQITRFRMSNREPPASCGSRKALAPFPADRTR
jgi:hypothetical protein